MLSELRRERALLLIHMDRRPCALLGIWLRLSPTGHGESGRPLSEDVSMLVRELQRVQTAEFPLYLIFHHEKETQCADWQLSVSGDPTSTEVSWG